MKRLETVREHIVDVDTLWAFFEMEYKHEYLTKSYKQERDYLVYFLCLLAVCWPGAQNARDNHIFACNFAKYTPLKFFSLSLSNEPFFICY